MLRDEGRADSRVDFGLISISAEPECEACGRGSGQSTRKKGDEGPRKQLCHVRESREASGACGMSAVLAGQVEVGAAQWGSVGSERR